MWMRKGWERDGPDGGEGWEEEDRCRSAGGSYCKCKG